MKVFRAFAFLMLTTPVVVCYSQTNMINTSAKGTGEYDAMIKIADSLYGNARWQQAKLYYKKALAAPRPDSKIAATWNKLGFSNQNLGLYDEAIRDYDSALKSKPGPMVAGSASCRLARIYSLTNKPGEAGDWLVKAAATGYNVLPDLDSLSDYNNLRASSDFAEIRKKVYETLYPCAADPRNHDFDFWLGDWDVYASNTTTLVGYSSIQSISGGCAILENWTSTQANVGKSINYYNPSIGKWEQDWIGSAGGPQRFINGIYKDAAMNFDSETVDSLGKKTLYKFKFFNLDKNTVRQYLEQSADGGKTFTPVYDFTYKRKGT